MPWKSKGRLKSARGQKINKEVRKEELERLANLKYVRSNGVANEDSRRVSRASRPTKQTWVKDNDSKCKDTFTTNENWDALPRGAIKSNPPLVLMSKEMKQSVTSKLNNHLLSSSKNIKDTGYGDGISLKEETPIVMGLRDDWISELGNSRVQVPSKMKATIRDTIMVQVTSVHNLPMLRLQTTQEHMQINHSLMNDVSGNVNDLGSQPTNVHPSKDCNVPRSPLEKSIEGSMRPQFKAMEGLVHKENNVNGLTKPDNDDQNLVDVDDDNGGGIRTRFPIRKNNEEENDRGAQSLMGCGGKTQDVKSKGRKESMQEKTYATLGGGGGDDGSEEVVRLTCGPKKKRRRYIVTSEDEEVEEDDVDHDYVGVESKERGETKADFVTSMDCIAKVPKPFIAECVKQQCYCCSKPIDEPVWRGTLKIDGKEYTSMAGHLSTKSCERVWELSISLQTTVEVMKLFGSKVKSKIWDSSKPSDDNIALYFLPREMRHDASLDQLINEVMENDLVLQAVIGESEMLIFPSCLLPERYKTFQRKHYLWALFKRREDKFAAAAKPLNGTAWCAQEEEKGKEHVSNQQDDVDNVEPNQEIILMNSATTLESQRLVNLHLYMEKQEPVGSARGGTEHSVNCKSPAESTQRLSASSVPCAANIGCQPETPDERKQEDARRHSVHVAEATAAAAAAAANSSAAIAEATVHATDAANIPANHEQLNSSMGVPLGKIFFVARQTPRVEQILHELDREGSLLFAMQERRWAQVLGQAVPPPPCSSEQASPAGRKYPK